MAKASGGTKGFEVIPTRKAKEAAEHFSYESPSGGSVTVNEQRIESSRKSKNERKKFDKEFAMCRVLADNGHTVVMLAETPGISSPDITLDGQKAELKSVSCTSTHIVDYAIKATTKQGAEIVIFQTDRITAKFMEDIGKIKMRNIQGMYFQADGPELYEI